MATGERKPSGADDRTLTSHGRPPSSRPGATGASSTRLVPGAKLGKYQVKRVIGEGGMGTVYEAVDTALQRSVALKFLPESVASDEQALKRFVREARSAAQLNHPNAVTVYDVARTKTTCLIAMELVRGSSAQDILDTKGRFTFEEATRLVADACRALVAAHKAGLVHRDIKPGNLLVSQDGTVKLSDFGLAKSVTADKASGVTVTQQNAVLGTPTFMSPEQCQNQPLDGRTDVYALGATYYSLLTGEAPYVRETTLQMLYAHCTEPPPDPRKKFNELPPVSAQIIAKAMAKRPDERYQTAQAMLDDLERALAGQDLSAGDVAETAGGALLEAISSVEPAAPWSPRTTAAVPGLATMPVVERPVDRRLVIALASIGGVALCLIIALVVFLALRSTDQPAPPPPVVLPVRVEPISAPPPAQVTAPLAAAPAKPVEATPPVEPPSAEPTPPVASVAPAPAPTPEPMPAPPPVVAVVPEPPPAEAAATTPPLDQPPPVEPTESQAAGSSSQTPNLVAPLRRLAQLKAGALSADRRNDQTALNHAAARLRDYYYEFKDSTVIRLQQAAEEARQLAEQYRPGLTSYPPGQAPHGPGESPPVGSDRRPPPRPPQR